jgi:hypothetical protein
MDTREAVETFRKLGNLNKLHRQIGLEKQSDLEAKEWLFKKFGLDPDDDDELFWEFRLDTPCISKEEADAICDGWIAKVDAAERVIKANAKSDKEFDPRIEKPNSSETIYKADSKLEVKHIEKDIEPTKSLDTGENKFKLFLECVVILTSVVLIISLFIFFQVSF